MVFCLLVDFSGFGAVIPPNVYIRLEAFAELVVVQTNGVHRIGGLVKVQSTSDFDYESVA